jgi:hypothetical protein
MALVVLGAEPGAAAARAPIRPVLGDWEGVGPLGLRISWAFVRQGRQTVVSDMALSLPTGCRSTGESAWVAGSEPRVEYAQPGTALHGPFPPLGPKQFFFELPPTVASPYPIELDGTFSDARHGVVSIASPTRTMCKRTAWPRTLRFTLAAAHRVPVADGLWTGSVTGARAGDSGTVKIRVIDGGRIETDIAVTFTCSGGGGNWELGPLATEGTPIEAGGQVVNGANSQSVWNGTFGAGGVLSGTFIVPGCGPPGTVMPFTATRTGS